MPFVLTNGVVFAESACEKQTRYSAAVVLTNMPEWSMIITTMAELERVIAV